MNEYHICRACGLVAQSTDAGIQAICPSCCATTWMITPSNPYEMARQLRGVKRKHTLRIFRAVYRRYAQELQHRKVKP